MCDSGLWEKRGQELGDPLLCPPPPQTTNTARTDQQYMSQTDHRSHHRSKQHNLLCSLLNWQNAGKNHTDSHICHMRTEELGEGAEKKLGNSEVCVTTNRGLIVPTWNAARIHQTVKTIHKPGKACWLWKGNQQNHYQSNTDEISQANNSQRDLNAPQKTAQTPITCSVYTRGDLSCHPSHNSNDYCCRSAWTSSSDYTISEWRTFLTTEHPASTGSHSAVGNTVADGGRRGDAVIGWLTTLLLFTPFVLLPHL